MQFLIEHAGRIGIAAPLRESDHFQHADGAVERDGEHIAWLHRVSGRSLAHAVDAHITAFDKLCRAGAGFDDPRMPQKLVEALAIQVLLLAITRKLLFQRR